MIINTKKSSFSGVMYTVRRLVKVEKIVRRLLEERCSARRDLTTSSMSLDMIDRLETGR